MIDQLVDMAIQIQQIPSPTFSESTKGNFIAQLFGNTQLTQIQTDDVGNVLACLPRQPGTGVISGTGQRAPLIISAHMDTVFPMETALTIRREQGKIYGPAIGDNSMGVAGLFGILQALRERNIQTPGDIWFVANTGEEGLGDLCGMKALVKRFGDTPIVYLILEGMAFGHIYHRAVGVQRFKISVHTQGGHSWSDYGLPSAIHVLSNLITQIANIKLPSHPHTTLNVGRIGGGTSINTIAAEAWMELDLRSEEKNSLLKLVERVNKLVSEARTKSVSIEMAPIGQRPSGEIPADHSVIRLAQSCLIEQGIEPVLTIGSTDANIPLSKGYPAIVLGLTHGGGAHTSNEYIETTHLEQGLEHLVQFVCRVWD